MPTTRHRHTHQHAAASPPAHLQLTIDIVEAVAQRHPRVLRVGFGTQDAPLQIAAAMIEYVVLEAARDPMGTLWRAGA